MKKAQLFYATEKPGYQFHRGKAPPGEHLKMVPR